MEEVEDIRHTIGSKEIYKLRSQTIERVFADAKEKHGMRYTQYRGIEKVRMELNLLFACMNLKKLAIWLDRMGILPTGSDNLFEKIFAKILNEVNKYGFIDDENIFIESFIETFILSNKWVKCECV